MNPGPPHFVGWVGSGAGPRCADPECVEDAFDRLGHVEGVEVDAGCAEVEEFLN